MLYRCAIKQLTAWKENARRKPLLLKGARQVGKTFLLRAFGRQHYQNVVEFNFEQDPGLLGLFEGNLEPELLIRKLAAYSSSQILPEKTLIILDEIQLSERALSSLKYFRERASQYHIACAGSLLGLILSERRSFPVGQVDILELRPLSLREFGIAAGKKNLFSLLREHDFNAPYPFHQDLIDLLRIYLVIGGMPEVVQLFVDAQGFDQIRFAQDNILRTYLLDFAKYAPPDIVMRIRKVWESVPTQLGRENRKFLFSAVSSGARAKEYESSIQWLEDAALLNRATRISRANLPLRAYQEINFFKLYLNDVGLLAAQTGTTNQTLLAGKDLFSHFKGALTENFVANELLAIGIPQLIYWTSKAAAEVDFVVEYGQKILPVEVKAGGRMQAKSLRLFQKTYAIPHGVLLSTLNFGRRSGVRNIPLYAVAELPRFLRKTERC